MKYGKRRTNPERWITPRFRKLSPDGKLVYLYLLDNCDWAGFTPIDLERISFETGIEQEIIQSQLDNLNQEEIVIKNDWLFVLGFIKLQDNEPLNPSNNAHKNILNKLKDNSIFMKGDLRFEKNIAPYKDLLRTTGKGNGKGHLSKGNGQGKSNEEQESEKIKEMEELQKCPEQPGQYGCTGIPSGEECGLPEARKHQCVKNPFEVRYNGFPQQ